MEHVVFFPAHDGTPAFRRVSSLEDAVRLVEHLRNVENVSEVSVHSLAEVPLAFKTWYRVEVPAGDVPAADEDKAPESAQPVAEESADSPVAELPELPEQPVPAMASSNGHATESAGPSSLGFFSS
jgi:hypothetical protein